MYTVYDSNNKVRSKQKLGLIEDDTWLFIYGNKF